MHEQQSHKSIRRTLLYCAAVAALTSSFLVSPAKAVTILSSDGDGADHYVSELTPTSTPTTDHRLFMRSTTSTTPDHHQVTYIRFDLSSVTGTVDTASLELYQLTNSNFSFKLYGLNDNASEASTPWDEGTITYNTAPGMNAADADVLTSDLNLLQVTQLGTTFALSSTVGTKTISHVDILSFLNSDTNGLVTFILEVANGANTTTNQFRSSRNAFTGSEHAPRLELTVVPEPGAFILTGIGVLGLGAIRLRKRSS